MAVYAIRNRRTGSVKIGYSSGPEDRLKTLQTGNEDELELVANFPNGSLRFESRLHEILDGYEERVRGEWFHGPVTNCIIAVLDLMNTELGVYALKSMLRRLSEMSEERRCYLSALMEVDSAERKEAYWPEQIVFLLSEEARGF